MADNTVAVPSPGYGWITAALALLLLTISLMLGLYLAGFYAQRNDRVIASVLLLLIAMLGLALAYWWHGWRLRAAESAMADRQRDTAGQAAEGSLAGFRARILARYGAGASKKKPWIAILAPATDPAQTVDERAQESAETSAALFIAVPDNIPLPELRSLRGRWRQPLDALVMQCGQALPKVGDAALQRLLDFNRRSGWRLPLGLALSGWPVPEAGVVLELDDASQAATTTRQLQQLAWQLAVEGQADVLQSPADTARLRLSEALGQPRVLEQLAQQLAEISRHLPPGQKLSGLSWVAGQATRLPGQLAQLLREQTARRHRLSPGDALGWLCAVLGLGLLLSMLLVFVQQQHRLANATQHLQALQQAATVQRAIPALLALQEDIQALQQAQQQNGWLRLGLDQAAAIEPRLLAGYGRAAQRWVVQPVQRNMQQVLQALNGLPLSGEDAAREPAQQQAYASLKAYLMLDQPARTEPGFLTAQLLQAAGQASGPRAQILRFYSSHLAALPGWRLPADAGLVESARQTLLSLDGVEHGDAALYRKLMETAAAKYPARSAASLLPGVDSRGLFVLPGSLPGEYTREAWEGYVREAIDKADPKQGGEALWVLGAEAARSDGAALKAKLLQRYFADYASAWQRYLNGLRWQNTSSLSASVEQLSVLSDPQRSPLQAVMTLLQYQGQAGAAQQSLASNLLDKTRQLVGKADKKSPAPSGLGQDDPLARAFGPLLLLTGAENEGTAGAVHSTVSLARYLDSVSAVRLKLQQLANAANPDAAARQLAQTLFKGQQNPLSDGQQYAALLAASLGAQWAGFAQQLFVSPLDNAGSVVILPAAAELNDLWRRSILLPWGSEMNGRFPFSRGEQEASLPALGRYLAPEQGSIASFLANSLAGALVQEGDQWLPNPTLSNMAPFDADFLNAINTLSRLASRWDTPGSPSYAFELKPIAMPGLVRTTLEFDGQSLSYFNQRESWSPLHWPGDGQQAGARLLWESQQSGTRQALDFNGRWGLIRLLEQARVEQLDPARYQLDIALPDGLTARYILRTTTGEGPLALLKLRQFKLPGRVFVVPGPPTAAAKPVASH
ncbi:ImcF-related family protein [Aquitalea magnusonii]|uniref:Type VI secretion system protein ImpL n=2 Tax=Aquitalea magnusonii TaxID=332411 RepID=A0A318IXC1_9NEIS|nr:ImcF-related family protein [Aquitalea magnusonii]PXX40119.1 type VI secretion system protein ImpL [Aquitalea magnusonii]